MGAYFLQQRLFPHTLTSRGGVDKFWEMARDQVVIMFMDMFSLDLHT